MRIGTRGSDLALWQARHVRALLQLVAGIESEIVIIETAGDKDRTTSLVEMTGKSFFTKEIEDALLDQRIDLAIHSLKDLQTVMPEGLALCAVPERVDRRDILLIRSEAFAGDQPLRLKTGARVGTSSSRRIAQLQFLRPDLVIEALRGNVPTRVRKLREGHHDAILLATAGLDRLALPLDDFRTYRIPESVLIPAPGQGALGIQIRENDSATRKIVAQLEDSAARDIVELEREVLRFLEGGCQLALGTAASKTERGYRLSAFFDPGAKQRPRRVTVNALERSKVVPATVDYLKGKTAHVINGPVNIWITREPERAGSFVSSLNENRFHVTTVPTLKIIEAGDKPRQDKTLSSLTDYDWIMFTSQVAVQEFGKLVRRAGVQIPKSTRLAAVGKKTSRAITDAGWTSNFVSDAADSATLAQQFLAIHDGPVGNILFPCGDAAGDELEKGLSNSVAHFERLICYDAVSHPDLSSTLKTSGLPHAVVFTSPQAARFLNSARPLDAGTIAVSIGPSTSEALLILGCPVVYEALDRSMEGIAEVINGLFPA